MKKQALDIEKLEKIFPLRVYSGYMWPVDQNGKIYEDECIVEEKENVLCFEVEILSDKNRKLYTLFFERYDTERFKFNPADTKALRLRQGSEKKDIYLYFHDITQVIYKYDKKMLICESEREEKFSFLWITQSRIIYNNSISKENYKSTYQNYFLSGDRDVILL